MKQAKYSNRFRTIFLSDLKSSIGVMVTLLLSEFVCGTMWFVIAVTTSYANRHIKGYSYLSINADSFAFMGAVLAIGAVVVGAISTAFMHSKKAMDVYGALPVRREKLLGAKMLSAAVSLTLPYVINAGIILIFYNVFSEVIMQSSITLAGLTQLFGATLICALAVLVLTFFCAATAGGIFDTVAFTLGLLVTPALVYWLFAEFVNRVIIGGFRIIDSVSLGIFGSINVYELSPLYMLGYILFGITAEQFNVCVIIYPIMIAVTVIGALWVFKKRKTEIAGAGKPSGVMQIIIKLIAAGFGGFGLAYVMMYSSNGNEIFVILGFMLGALIPLVIVEAVLSRGFKNMVNMLKPFGIACAGFILLFAVLRTGGFGYTTRVPDASDVASVEIGGSEFTNYYGEEAYTSPETIEAVVNLHNEIVKDPSLKNHYKAQFSHRDELGLQGVYIDITYTLKNGRKLTRCFGYAPYTPEYDRKQMALVTTDEYLEKTAWWYMAESTDSWIQRVDILTNDRISICDSIIYHSTQEQKELLNALRADYKAQTKEQIINPGTMPLVRLIITTDKYMTTDCSINVYPWNTNTLAYLKANCGVDAASQSYLPESVMIRPSIIKVTGAAKFDDWRYKYSDVWSDVGIAENMLIKDKTMIAQLCRVGSNKVFSFESERYYSFVTPVVYDGNARLDYNSGMVYYIPENKAPAWLIELVGDAEVKEYNPNETPDTAVAEQSTEQAIIY